ncbi:conjugal transfer protein TraC [Amycolatopsis sp. Hca4]|uniref:conjugal transfer protein TraC n=1 Tax=Amycolatopsis sp. Hca4 TaxID=2742131 RepID=UPI0020CAA9F3|nr:conjugal transfer protein TraC [Amycolatopsis sp. Hca4]
MDGYFGTGLDAQPMAGGDDRRAELLEGVSEDLKDGANDALDALEVLRMTEIWLLGFDESSEQFRKMQDEVAGVYREFSDADIDHESTAGLQSLIMKHDDVWKQLQRDSKPKLDDARQFLGVWRGSAANAVKAYLNQLADAFTEVETKITVLESDVVAAREAIASARQDLSNLGTTFLDTAKQYQEDQSRKREAAMSKVLAATFAGAVAGLLTVASAGVAAPAGAAIFTAANGALVAGNAAGGAISAMVANQAEITGDNAFDLYQSFLDSAGKIRDGAGEAAGTLANRIGDEAVDLPKIPDPPDVSPGSSFDPSDFETDHTSRETEKNVRDANVDIAPDGQVSSGATHVGRLDG